jgi:perosamine synthetase
MAIARARVYHSVPFDVRNLVTSSVATLRSQGPPDDQVIETFERRFAEHVGAAHCVSFAFARTAVHQALESQALPHGSEVLMPPITISPMMDAVLSLGLRPVFVDIDPNSLIFDVEAFERAITPNTRAALITYLFGIAADPTPLIEVRRGPACSSSRTSPTTWAHRSGAGRWARLAMWVSTAARPPRPLTPMGEGWP